MISRKQLYDPGFVPNVRAYNRCFEANILMAMRGRPHSSIPSIEELNDIVGESGNYYSWPFKALVYLNSLGYDTKFISLLDLPMLTSDPQSALLAHYGPTEGADQVQNSDLESLSTAVSKFLSDPNSEYINQVPGFATIKSLIDDGYYLNLEVNQRILQGDTGYIGHGVFLYGYDNDGVLLHNPGPPPTVSTHTSWYMLDRAWSAPIREARILMAMRPPAQDRFFDYLGNHD